ncbi:MAG TPA: hypothetical protein VF950_19965 [Planctomycetota bacterium]
MSLFLALLPALSPVEGLAAQDPHPLKHRILTTWDTWICEDDPAGKSYLAEYKDLVDWMSRNDYNALIVWGFVDARHGGEPAAKDLARYAKSKGIALLPGVSAPAPICYAKPENRESLRTSMEALLEAYDVDGVHLETAEAGFDCGCVEHLSVCAPIVADVLRARRKEPLLTYAPGGSLWWERKKAANDVLGLLPEACVAQWNLELAQSDTPSPVKHNLARLGAGGWSAHLRRRSTERAAFALIRGFYPKLEDIRLFAVNARKMAFEGFVAGVGGSPKSPDAELAYLAFLDFTRDPSLTMEAFFKKHVPRLYGDAAAEDVAKLLLAQPALHEKAVPYWKAFEGKWPEGDAKEVAAALGAQVALAKGAATKASADGKRRLDAILPILEEYRVICEAAAAGISDKGKLAEAYEKAGLPDDLYGYKKWK